MLSAVMEDYLKAIYQLQHDREGRVRTSEIAEYLDVTPPTVTSMLDKLEERELIAREKYKGVTLTPAGDRIALEVIRHHRLIEAYLTEYLDYSISDVHEEADRLEHHISDDFADRVAAALEDPTTDPHGDPIPNEQLELPREPPGQALTEFAEGATVTVERVSDRNPQVLEYLSDHGIDPGTKLTVTEIAPFGMVTVQSTEVDEHVSMPDHVAAHVRVSALKS